MNWARDDARISPADFKNVFKYYERATTVMKWSGFGTEPSVGVLEDREWEGWLRNARDGQTPTQSLDHKLLTCLKHCPDPPSSEPGVYIILAKSQSSSLELPEKRISNEIVHDTITNAATTGGQRSLRTVSFSESTFRHITTKFYTHGSIGPVISNADNPIFSHAEVHMADDKGRMHLAHVFNCRSSNTWQNDLALTVTYLPHFQKTFCIMFGCDDTLEATVRARLLAGGADVFHPLLMPGIMVELERIRHVSIVDRSIGAMETKIAELDSIADQMGEEFGSRAAEQRNCDRRTAWLDTAYLQTGLINWNNQLEKFRHCVTKLHEDNTSSHTVPQSPTSQYNHSIDNRVAPARRSLVPSTHRVDMNTKPCYIVLDSPPESVYDYNEKTDKATEYPVSVTLESLRDVGDKMVKRIKAIEEEYGQKIRDCTMRLDGMSMATQWAQGETNMAIAMATSRDSKHMRFIALVTMVYLPGTFFAGVFSMSFFNWQGSEKTVSSSFWIYVLFSVSFTLLTIWSWWYFVVHRPKRVRKHQEDEFSLV